MANETSVESLFKEHSFEEIESVRDNLALEIGKRTELLKSIVKEKYTDVVETSDAVQSMKLKLKDLEQSVWNLDKSISKFYTRLKETPIVEHEDVIPDCDQSEIIRNLLQTITNIWDYFDSGNLKTSVRLSNGALSTLEEVKKELSPQHHLVFKQIELSLKQSREMIKNYLWYRIQSAEPNQIGVIAGTEENDLYQISLNASIEFLVEKLKRGISDTSFQAQIRRHQPASYFNIQTNEIDHSIEELRPPTTGYIQIPGQISPELSEFLYEVCRVINTIAGFSLSKSSIIDSLQTTIEHIFQIYSDLVPLISGLKAECRRKRAFQLYFDLLYIRVLLNTSRSIELIEKLEPKVSELSSKFESMLDRIELYTVSAALHNNVISLSHSTIRLYGLLIPRL